MGHRVEITKQSAICFGVKKIASQIAVRVHHGAPSRSAVMVHLHGAPSWCAVTERRDGEKTEVCEQTRVRKHTRDLRKSFVYTQNLSFAIRPANSIDRICSL